MPHVPLASTCGAPGFPARAALPSDPTVTMSNAVAPAPVSAFNLFGFSDDQFEKAIPSISDNAPLLCFVGAIYVPVQFFLRDVMVKHERFGLRWFAIPWNALLATFSFLGAIHTLPQAVESLYTRGFTASMCDVGFYHSEFASKHRRAWPWSLWSSWGHASPSTTHATTLTQL